jgi:predicted nucleic acid-binding Zn ribbon protein
VTRRSPRPLGPALDALLERLAPSTTLAAVQAVWSSAVGAAVAAHGTPAREREGILTVACDEAVWAHEIELMGPDLVAAVNDALGREALSALNCRGRAQAPASRPGGTRRAAQKNRRLPGV